MKSEMLQITLENSRRFSKVIRMGDDHLMVPTEFGLDGIYSTVSLLGESGCLFKHPAALYETPSQAELFLDKCNTTPIEHTGIEFHDDPIAKCIMAVKKYKVNNKWTFLRNVADDLMAFAYCVKAIRDSMANLVLDTISPVSIDAPERSLLYLSLMQPYESPWGWGWNTYLIDWNDVRTIWKKSKAVLFVPQIDSLGPGGLYSRIVDGIKDYSGGEASSLIIYFGLPSSADTSDLMSVLETANKLRTQNGYHILYCERNHLHWDSPYTALVAILK